MLFVSDRCRVGLVGLSLLLAGAAGFSVRAQDAPTKKSDATAEVKKKAVAKGRVPAYFGDVVSGAQRETIYAIQAKHNAEIKKLQTQLTALVDLRDKEVEAVLTPEQKEKVTKLASDAKAKRAAATKKPPADAAQPAKPAPGTTK